jgi:class 3 adenylate cyclase/tetratricopeptide (TPR) repeat protein
MAACRQCGSDLPEAARFCPSCGARVAIATAEERKVVTVLFADLVASTAAASTRDPEDVRAAVQPQLARMRTELERFGGTVEKYVGDAVMAVFGAPVVHEDDAERAVRAALAIRDALGRSVKVAVNTGEAVVDLNARPDAGEAMASGDVLNTTYRIEEAAPAGAVLVGESTYRATDAAIEYGECRLVTAKGKPEPLRVWEAIHARGAARAVDDRPPLAPLVGRRQELSLIVDTLARAKRDRTVQLLTLVGPPGIGKSRLAWELERALADDPGLVTWRRGRCLPYGDAVTFWALADILKSHSGIFETDDANEAARKLHRSVRDLIADQAEADWVEGHLAPVVGLTADAPAQERREEAFAAWRRLFEALAEWGPLVLVVEDVHWADDGLLDFIDHLADWATTSPLLLLCTARAELFERRPNWGARRNAATLALAPLTDDETRKLVAFLLRQAEIPADLAQTVLAHAEGNPLYTEEFIRMLVDRSLLHRDGGGWKLRESELPLPESVQGIIAARLDALPAEQKTLLQEASVFGRAFWGGAVAAVVGKPVSEVEESLRVLEQKEFVRQRKTSSVAGEREYAFHHSLARDVAYHQIPRAQRSDKHLRAANWFEVTVTRRQDRVELLAHHLWKATALARAVGREDDDLAARARSALRDAGERALSLNSFEAAANYFSAGLEISPHGAQRAALLFGYGKSLFHGEESGEAELAQARDAFLAAGDHQQAAEAEAMLATLARFVGADHDRAFQHLERAAALVEDAPPSPAKAYVLSAFANALGIADEHERALVEARRALEIARELGLRDVEARCLNTIGWLRATRGDLGGFADLEQSIVIGESVNSPFVVLGYANLASVHLVLGDLARAFEVAAAGRKATAHFGRVYGSRWLMDGLRVHEEYYSGRWDEAARVAEEILGDSDRESHSQEILVRIFRARIRLARGDEDSALEDSERALEVARAAKDVHVLYPALAYRGRVLAATGLVREASEASNEFLAAFSGDEWCMDSFWIDLAVTLHTEGRRQQLLDAVDKVRWPTRWVAVAEAIGKDDFVRAADICASIGSGPDEAFLRLLAADELERLGQHEAADAQRRDGVRFYELVGAPRPVPAASPQ